jgi:gamma-glutamyltranspeptidase/glutathione hydrolase
MLGLPPRPRHVPRRSPIRPGVAAFLTSVSAAFAPSAFGAEEGRSANAERGPFPIAARHMIVAAEPAAAEAGREILRAGGSAVDAAIAAQLVLTMVEPQSSGIGGGAYIMVSDEGGVSAYDGRETAPSSVTPGMFLDATGEARDFREVRYGGLSVGVPGMIAVMALAHREHGRLDWERLFAPAIRLAEDGFAVPARLADALEQARERFQLLPDMRAQYFHPEGRPFAEGERMMNAELAASYRLLAAEGEDAFYHGALAEEISEAVANAPVNPAVMTLADIASYEAIARMPLCRDYRGYRACSVPPSTSGGTTVLEILGLLERYPTTLAGAGALSSVHLISEASRLAYADRGRWLGDPAFVETPVAGLLEPGYLDARARLIDMTRSMGVAEAGTPPRPATTLDYAPMAPQASYGTSHLAVVDDTGMVVSMTMTVQAAFGAGIAAGGFLLNNELTDFAFEPEADGQAVANAAAPGKRPLSSMSPFLIFDENGAFFAALGSPGGSQIIAYTLQGIVSLIDGGLSMQDTANAPRHVSVNGTTYLEEGTVLESHADELAEMGHEVEIVNFESGLNGIRRVDGGYEGGADPRRSGVALGD